MTVRQAGEPATDEQLARAFREGAMARTRDEWAWCGPGTSALEKVKCRLYPKLSFFFDGTGNNLWHEMRKPVEERALSNIAKLYQAAINDRIRSEAAPTYIPGVGTPYRYPYANVSPNEDKGGVLGLGFGAGGEMRLQAALFEFRRLLEDEWGSGALRHMQTVSLSVFGFSRGATLARAFVRRLIEDCCERTADGLMWKATFGQRVRLRIVFMGLFDTVASVGGPGLHMAWGSELAIPPEVERCVHFVSAHEVRQAFPLDSIRIDESYAENCEEVVYPGVHADVGGGYFDGFQGRCNALSRIPLRDMYMQALRSGVMLQRLEDLPAEDRQEMVWPDGSALPARYSHYMACLPMTGGTLESLIQAHRKPKFMWRSAITRERQDWRVLGGLHRQVDASMCAAVPARNNHWPCPPKTWRYELPRHPGEQARQLLAEHRRLVGQIPAVRHPVERQGDLNLARARTPYEDLLIDAWDTDVAPRPEVMEFFEAHVHDSVAHFTDWPCALHEPRGIYCDRSRYLAKAPVLPPALVT